MGFLQVRRGALFATEFVKVIAMFYRHCMLHSHSRRAVAALFCRGWGRMTFVWAGRRCRAPSTRSFTLFGTPW